MILAGWIMTGLLALFMLGASVAPKLMGSTLASDPLTVVGWPVKYMLLIGVIELACTVLFVIPKTGLLGAVLLTGLLAAALAANLRVDNPLFSHTLFSLYLGVFAWVALWLREPGLREVFPFVG
jgi:DoxX-like family